MTKARDEGWIAKKWQNDDEGEGGSRYPPKNDDVIYEQPPSPTRAAIDLSLSLSVADAHWLFVTSDGFL